MLPVTSLSSSRPVRSRTSAAAALLAAVLLSVAACGSSGGNSGESPAPAAGPQSGAASTGGAGNTGSSGSLNIAAPPNVKSAGVLKVCADIVYPPYTFMQDNKPVGIDVDLANTLAGGMGVHVEWVQTAFPGIVGALQGGKCDAIVNGINGTPEHAKVIAQVAYLRDTQGFLTKKGNPAHINSLEDLQGKSIATQLGSSTATYLEGLNKKFRSEGKTPMKLTTLPQDTAAFSAVLTGRVDAYFQDGPVLGYYAKKYPEVEVLPLVANPQTVVVGIRKDDTALNDAVTQGVKQMYKLDMMQSIAKKWGATSVNFLPDMPGPTS
jgi:ABC-type amino acid transport substrate-binding protein